MSYRNITKEEDAYNRGYDDYFYEDRYYNLYDEISEPELYDLYEEGWLDAMED